MKLSCLIVDDEPIAQEIIEGYLEPFDQITIIGKCKDALEASRLLQEHAIDFIFLDIEMPHLNGLSLIKNLDNPPKVIITTAYREYALEGFELNAVDYLLKPISQERFLKAINRILVKPRKLEFEFKTYIYLKVDMKMVQVYLDEILYIEGLSNYVRVNCEKRTLISYQKLSHLEEVLDESAFKRCHRSYIVNLKRIKAYTSQDLEVGKDGRKSIPIGGSYKEQLFSELEKFQR